jgi:hypothetical protein
MDLVVDDRQGLSRQRPGVIVTAAAARFEEVMDVGVVDARSRNRTDA